MTKTTTLLAAALLLAGCAGRASLPSPALPQAAPVAPQTSASGCTTKHDATTWRHFQHGAWGIKGIPGDVATQAAVQNDMSNGAFIRSGEHKKTYIEGSGTYTLVIFKTGHAARNVILSPIPGHKPTSGDLFLAITYCPE